MASYNEDPIDRALSYWDDGDAWTQYKERFLTKTKSERVDALIKADEYLAGDLKPTHETASLWPSPTNLPAMLFKKSRQCAVLSGATA